MGIPSFWIYVILEALVLLSAYVVYLFLANRRLRSQLHSQASPAETDKEEGSPDGNYLEQLQAEIQRTEAKHQQLDTDKDVTDPELRQVLETRLGLLRAEEAAAGNNDDEEKFWAQLKESLTPFLPSNDEIEGEQEAPPTQEAENDQIALIELLRDENQNYQVHIANLEKYKKYFFELKEKYAENRDLGEKLQDEVGKAVPEDEQSPELRDALDKLREINSLLQEQLANIEDEFSSVLGDQDEAAGTSGEASVSTDSMLSISEGVEHIKEVITEQDNRIGQLSNVISELQLEVKDKESIEQALNDLTNKLKELTEVVSSLEEENIFLQEQISALLKQELASEKLAKQAPAGEDSEKINGLSETITNLEEENIFLQEQISALLKQELASEKQAKQSSAGESSEKIAELSEAIANLEEENIFLQEQISALLKQELQDATKAKDETEKHRLENEERAAALAQLEQKYSDMESKYLALYEESQRMKA